MKEGRGKHRFHTIPILLSITCKMDHQAQEHARVQNLDLLAPLQASEPMALSPKSVKFATMEKPANFKVIVIGVGPVGLTTAHILAKASIDFVVLERRETVHPDEGAGIAVGPTTYRLLDQLDLLNAFEEIATPIETKNVMTRDGQLYNSYEFHMREYHGRHIAFVHRHHLLKTLYDTLPADAQERIKTSKRVTSISTTEHGVTVTCDDGSVELGSIVIGADGVHSKTRSLMATLSGHVAPVFPSAFQGLFGNIPREKLPFETAPSDNWEAHSSGLSSQFFVGRERAWFIIYRPLPKPTTERVEYTQEDVNQFAEDIKDLHLTPKFTFGEVFPKANKVGLTLLQEGLVEQRSHGRIVLIGDAASKITPNLGLGYNSGVLDAIVLINHLREVVLAAKGPDGVENEITEEQIKEVFREYEKDRKDLTNKVMGSAHGVVRNHTWLNAFRKVFDRYLTPALNLESWYGKSIIGPQLGKQQVLEWVEEKNLLEGKIPWVHRPSQVALSEVAVNA
ncbi:hypothetical protein QBC34DRAFT_401438 [Podospora aff. communis PSN243]|uniref:FAD-binding domain-containing protein n=1 Tax=Podospora aff. communis PSN243 TaxID=3040156 RepID=A0AAV9GT22_9PEZI|nr:hypothetical protein QBC34DRAFT_401438 [Podospora aff. communis PSN243]